MKEKTSIVTVTCLRDLPLLDLQAQSIFNYLDKSVPIYIVVNEDDTTKWFDFFNKHLKHYYQNHNLTIFTKADFTGDWHYWIHSEINPWAVGWETQQVLKLCIANKIKTTQYLILDSQNFLIQDWTPNIYKCENTPARPGHFVMPVDIWNQYCEKLGIKLSPPTSNTMSMCTPIFFNTNVVQQLIEHTGGEDRFALWFKHASTVKSEFILYALWLEKLGGFIQHHTMYPVPEDWGNPMLRDCKSEEDFIQFLNFIGKHHTHAWVSANHRAWGNMSNSQYNRLKEKLSVYNLVPHFDQYRNDYIDLKF